MSAHEARWWDGAACRATDPRLFFPGPNDMATAARARAVCAGCPVIEECRRYAVETCQEGIWGGTSPRERMRTRASMAAPSTEATPWPQGA